MIVHYFLCGDSVIQCTVTVGGIFLSVSFQGFVSEKLKGSPSDMENMSPFLERRNAS